LNSATNETRCLLAYGCKLAGGAACNDNCPHFIAMHGRSGNGGRVAAASTPADYRLYTLANSPARDSQTAIYRTIEAYVQTFDRQFEADAPRIKSLYLYSESPGTGKTTTASVVLNEWIRVNYSGSVRREIPLLQRPAYFLDVNEWQELYNGFSRKGIPQEIAEQKSRPYYRQMELAKKTPFVVLDDIGVRSATEAFRGDLHAIINYRTVNALPTIYTSNVELISSVPDDKRVEALKPYDIKDIYDDRLADRMRDQCAVLHFEGESKRGKRK